MKKSIVVLCAALLSAVSMAGDLALLRKAARIKPAYTVAKEKRFDYSTVKRVRISAVVPSGLSTNEVVDNLKHALLQYTLDNHAVAVAFCEKGDNVDSMYTVAMGEWVPYGDWGKAEEGLTDTNLDTYKFVYKLCPGYFKTPDKGAYSGLTKTQRNQLVAEMEAAALKVGQEGSAEMNKAGDFSAAACRKQMIREDERKAKAYTSIAASYGLTKEQAEELWSNKLTEQFGK